MANENTLHDLQRESIRPLHEQITDRLLEHIQGMKAGQQLPTETELMSTFGVSRSTVRKAVKRLVTEGVLSSRAGKGTFISAPLPKIVHAIDHLAPFFETFKRAGENINTRIIEFSGNKHLTLPESLSDWGQPVFCFQRVYTSGGIPHAVTKVVLPKSLGVHISQSDVEHQPIYSVLTNKLKLELCRADFWVSCRPPDKNLSDLLSVSPSTFLLVLERITHSKDGAPVEMTTHYLRPDVYQLSVSLDALRKT